MLSLSDLKKRHTLTAVTSAVLMGLTGCATTQRSGAGGQGAAEGGTALVSAEEGSPQVSSGELPQHQRTLSAAPRTTGELHEDEFRRLIGGLPPENVSVVIHEDRGGASDMRALSRVITEPAVDQFALLGVALRHQSHGLAPTERPFVKALSALCIGVAQRIHLDAGTIGPTMAPQLRDAALSEFAEWMNKDAALLANRDRYMLEGRREVLREARPEAPLHPNPAEAISRSVGQLVLLRDAIKLHGRALWGDHVASHRFQTMNLVIRMLDADLQVAERGGALDPRVVNAHVMISDSAEQMSRIVTLGADPIAVSFRPLSPSSAGVIRGSSPSDPAGYAAFLNHTGASLSADSLTQWLLVRQLPLERMCTGSVEVPPVAPTAEQLQFFESEEALRRRGPLR
jgi:hypothetical protein